MKHLKLFPSIVILFVFSTGLMAQPKLYMNVTTPNGYLVPADPGARGIGINESYPQHSLHILETGNENTALFLDLKQTLAPSGQGFGGYYTPDYAFRVNYQLYGSQSGTVFSISENGQTRIKWDNTSATENLAVGQDMAVYRNSGNYLKMGFDGGSTPTMFWGNGSGEPLQFKSDETGNVPLYLSEDGKVGINTDNFLGDHSLYINGSAIGEEMWIKAQANWPDYVFAANYDLMSLGELREFIAENGHLPNMPSAEDVAQNGIALGETERILTEKVEELTLYLIEMKDEMDALKSELEELKSDK